MRDKNVYRINSIASVLTAVACLIYMILQLDFSYRTDDFISGWVLIFGMVKIGLHLPFILLLISSAKTLKQNKVIMASNTIGAVSAFYFIFYLWLFLSKTFPLSPICLFTFLGVINAIAINIEFNHMEKLK